MQVVVNSPNSGTVNDPGWRFGSRPQPWPYERSQLRQLLFWIGHSGNELPHSKLPHSKIGRLLEERALAVQGGRFAFQVLLVEGQQLALDVIEERRRGLFAQPALDPPFSGMRED